MLSGFVRRRSLIWFSDVSESEIVCVVTSFHSTNRKSHNFKVEKIDEKYFVKLILSGSLIHFIQNVHLHLILRICVYVCIYIYIYIYIYTHSGYGKYSDPLTFFTLCYIAAIC